MRDRNFSLGVNLMIGLVEQVAARLGEDWDIEITEGHHRRKVDAPSGTALMIGEAAARGRGAPLADLRTPPHDGQSGPRRQGSIAFSVIRGGGIIGDHDAAFISMRKLAGQPPRPRSRHLRQGRADSREMGRQPEAGPLRHARRAGPLAATHALPQREIDSRLARR